MNYYERHIGDYLKDTAHLSLIEHGVYTRLLDVYYTREAPLPSVDVARLIGARTRDERSAMEVVLAEFFIRDGDTYRQARCDREIARLQDKRSKASASANARWSKREPQSDGIANASPDAMRTDMRTHSEGNARAPVPRHQTPDTKEEKNPPASRVPPETGPAIKPERASARGSRLPTTWDPGEPGYAFAAQQGLMNGRAQAEFAKFRDYWLAQPGQKGVKTDWQATWRNWVRKACEIQPQRGAGGAGEYQGNVL